LIRVAGIDDLDLVYSLAVEFKNKTPYAQDPVTGRFREFVGGILLQDKTKTIVFLLEDGSGMLAATSTDKFWNEEKSAIELMFYVSGNRNYQKAKVLVHAYEYWAKEIVKAKTIQLVSIDDLDKLYQRWGYTPAERTYVKEIN
jgi:hypothetical protein